MSDTPREWFSPAEVLALGSPALPGSMSALADLITRDNWRSDPTRARIRLAQQGGGWEYHVSLLPAEVQARLIVQAMPAIETPVSSRSAALWADFERLSEKAKAEAQRRLVAVDQVETLTRGGQTRQLAVAFVAREQDVSARTLWSWIQFAGEVARADRLAALAPRHAGRTATAECDPRAWDAIVADYLRPEQPAFSTCYWRMTRTAKAEGWSPVPSEKTLARRIQAEFPRAVQTLMRQGSEAAERIYPHQRRDRSIFKALEAINGDGHKFDVFVKWGDGTISRPIMIGFQDLYSGLVLCHRIDRTESKHLVRLALADVITAWGIPEHAYLDNGRAFASKWITGGIANRYRFKPRDEEPDGLLTTLGVRVHWTKPYHGQSKPIERAWRTMCGEISKHPAFAGAYTGNKPDAKPENYGSKAIPIDVFRARVASEIAAHNARPGRSSATAKGRSFLETFEDSRSQPDTLIQRATAEQRRMFLLASEAITPRKPTGIIELLGSRYWDDALPDQMGKSVIVRFDPQDLAAPIAVYTLDNRFICEAAAIGDVAFNDVDEARAHARRRSDFVKATKAAAEAGRRLDIDTYADLIPQTPIADPAPAKVVRMAAGGRRHDQSWEGEDAFSKGLQRLADESGDVIPFGRR